MTPLQGITYTIDKKTLIVLKEHHGTITLEDEVGAITRLFNDPDFEIGMNILCDLGDAEGNWDLKQMDRFRAFLGDFVEKASHSKWAIVAPGGPTNHNARLFVKLNDSLGGKAKMRVFTDRQSAIEWFATADIPLVAPPA